MVCVVLVIVVVILYFGLRLAAVVGVLCEKNTKTRKTITLAFYFSRRSAHFFTPHRENVLNESRTSHRKTSQNSMRCMCVQSASERIKKEEMVG